MCKVNKVEKTVDSGENPSAKNKANYILIEYLYLDLKTCDRCMGTEGELDYVVKILIPVIDICGFKLDYKKIEMSTTELALEYRFLSSPTIRVNGKDIFNSVTENACGCCSDISGTSVMCRTFDTGDGIYEIPKKEILARLILEKIFDKSQSVDENTGYEMPTNLKNFYIGKNLKNIIAENNTNH